MHYCVCPMKLQRNQLAVSLQIPCCRIMKTQNTEHRARGARDHQPDMVDAY